MPSNLTAGVWWWWKQPEKTWLSQVPRVQEVILVRTALSLHTVVR